MAKYWCYFLFLLWFSYMILSSVLLFTKGFLLSRVTQNINSSCTVYPNDNNSLLSQINSASKTCLPQKAKVVLLIIDALRYDFTVYNEELQQQKQLPYQNKLPVINELLKKYPDSTRLYKFVADPPTTTMQRLNALTTGSLPTFIDAGSNFATSEISEDNIIDQLVKHDRKIVFMGDDTWIGLYPNRFLRSYSFPSFDVRDLDTVDDGVIENLYPELKKNDFDLLIGHFLGVDHCGHRYGPYHSEMSRKLSEMNEVIENVVKEIDDSTVLIVIGDHGMTETGDHGGSSENEVTSAMFLHSRSPLKNQKNPDTIKQVDLVPTLATILGVPIPFSNLGTLIIDSIPLKNETSNWHPLLFALFANVQQTFEYITEYSKNTAIFNKDNLQELSEKFSLLNARVHSVKTEEDFEKFADDSRSFLFNLRQICEDVWVQFDSFSISRGLLLLFLSIFFVYMIIDGIPAQRLAEIFMSTFLISSYVALLIAVIFSFVLCYFELVDNLLLNIYFSTGITSLFMLAMLVIQNWEVIALHWYERTKKNKLPNLFFRLILILSVCGVFSNSYVVEENYVLLFLAITIVFFSVYDTNLRSNQKRTFFVLIVSICGLSRLAMYFWRCREEQQWCFLSDTLTTFKNLQGIKNQWTLTLISLALLVTLTRIWLRNCGNLLGHSFTVILARYCPTVVVACVVGYFVLNRLPKETKTKVLSGSQPDLNMLAWTVYLLIFLGIFMTFLKPICVYVLPKKSQLNSGETSSLIPQLFRQVKGLFDLKRKENDEVPIVCGLATVYSTVFVVVGVYFSLLWALLLGDVAAPAAPIAFVVLALFVVAVSIARIQKITQIEQLFEIPSSTILSFSILAQYFFYASGHQPTFPNIAWEAAFIGTSGTFKHNFIPASLILINTFGSHILVSLLLPLVLIAPFSLFVMMPSVIPKRNFQKDLSRGEILLYERSGEFLKSVFVLFCKYVMFQGLKVFASMLSATIHCRHLMVWKIFAPKLIFESIGILFTLGTLLVTYLLLIRVHYKVDQLVYCLNKQSS